MDLQYGVELALASADIVFSNKAAPDHVMARQSQRLAELTAYARERSPFYREHYAHVPQGAKAITDFPPVRKPLLMANFDGWVTDPAVTLQKAREFSRDLSKIGDPFLDKYLLCTTSGTTGEPALLLHDAFDLNVFGILALLRSIPTYFDGLGALKAFRHGVRTAMFSAGGGHFSGLAGFLRNQRRMKFSTARLGRFFDVLEPIQKQIDELNTFQPTVLVGYPSAMWLVAQEQRAGRLNIAPKLVVAMGETLTDTLRQDLADAFDCPVRGVYASSECFGIANECPAGRLHLNSDWVIVEAVDRDYQPVPPGTLSHTTLITNLANRVQPFIRYDLGDGIIISPDPCSCGRKLPTVHVQGRSGDLLRFPARQTNEDVLILPLAFETVIEETPGVHRFQAIQGAKDLVRFKLETEAGSEREHVWESLARNVNAFLDENGASAVQLELLDELPSQNPRTGKFKTIECWKEHNI